MAGFGILPKGAVSNATLRPGLKTQPSRVRLVLGPFPIGEWTTPAIGGSSGFEIQKGAISNLTP